MKKRHTPIDDFTLRRRTPADPKHKTNTDTYTVPRRFLDTTRTPGVASSPKKTGTTEKAALLRSELDASLAALDDEKKPKKRRFWPPSKKAVKRTIVIILILILAIVGFLGIRAFLAGTQVLSGNLFDLFSQGKPLKMDENGRSNILIFGTSEDDRAHDDAGPHLTDSIMVASLDQNKKVTMLTSVPRDLWVKYGDACMAGYEGKINALYQCMSDDGRNERTGAQKLMQAVGEVYGLKMHYYVHVNYTALKEAVDAVGGIDVVIESSDPRGILDRNFDWECNYQCYLVKYPNGPAHLDGKRALALARARNSSGGYGLERGNFDRERNQQKILIALRDKAASVGTLANPAAVSQLIDTLGKNVRTNFEAGEMRTLINVGQAMKNKDITTLSLDSEENKLITTDNVAGQSIVRPMLGLYDFSDIHRFIKRHISNDPVIREAAKIDVLNGSGVPGMAQQTADKLEAKNYTIHSVDTAPADSYSPVQIHQLNPQKKGTKQKLEQLYGIKVISGNLPAGIVSEADFVIIIGAASTGAQ
ncbi:MAG TPA: LCP family protein [Verrucomicrobiae bacterium]|nr:LCP family protein [Verrucomicrobiae bacterium]